MKNTVLLLPVFVCLLLNLNMAFAEGVTNIYIINNNQNNNEVYAPSRYGSGYGVMCTERNGFCTNGYYIMGTQRTIYTPTRSRLKAARAAKLGLNI